MRDTPISWLVLCQISAIVILIAAIVYILKEFASGFLQRAGQSTWDVLENRFNTENQSE